MRILRSLTLLLVVASLLTPLHAAPRVVVTIKPLHSIVSAVMNGVGDAHLLVDDNRSPHFYAMKASAARALADAEVVVWVGDGLERFMRRPIASLATGATQIRLDQLQQLRWHNWRADALHGLADLRRDAPAHDKPRDYHLWLDPDNATALASAIAQTLARLDADNAAVYQRNAQQFANDLEATVVRVRELLAPVHQRRFVTMHDSFQYFERYFDLRSAGVIAVQPDTQPGAATLQQLQREIDQHSIACLFAEPQFPSRLVKTLARNNGINDGLLDPIGTELAAGPQLYAQLLLRNAQAFARCLSVIR